MIRRFSSRRQKPGQYFLNERLKGARAYDRIAGYFSSSILEVAGEALESMGGPIRVICNSGLNFRDVETATAARYALRREWCASEPENYGEKARGRFERLYDFLRSGKMMVRVLPDEKFGLIHGKAGVITLEDGTKTAFMGSANETYQAWKLNYELVWEDDSPEAITWVQEEFDALWSSPLAVDLAEFVIEDIGRISRRTVLPEISDWKDRADPAEAIVEMPVYRREYGLWEHQKYFVKLAFDAHRGLYGARFVLADTVGLGKTVQLALSAMLMALHGDRPVLVLVPKALLWQWQDEMRDLLDMPSAVWTGRQWVDEHGIEHPVTGPDGIVKCPRRVGIVSQGLITSKSEVVDYLKQLRYECIIVDESHRARRKNLGPDREGEKADPNNLLAFLYEISLRTKSMLLATATPVQIQPVEAWDLLNVLAVGNSFLLGNDWSHWRRAAEALAATMGHLELPEDDLDLWAWIRNPLPPASEDRDFELIRRTLRMEDREAIAAGDTWEKLRPPDRARVVHLRQSFAQHHNPFIRHIVRRTRQYLENTLDPETGEPYLKPIKVELFGEGDDEAIRLPAYLQDAYLHAEEFCHELSERAKGSGFMKTLLLRRIGSTIYAGRNTAEKLLTEWEDLSQEDDEDEFTEVEKDQYRTLTQKERTLLETLIDSLDANLERDPKYHKVVEYLFERNWIERGCIVFSQYYDSVWWLANQLSGDQVFGEDIGIYAGGDRSGIIREGVFRRESREELKRLVRTGELRLVLGTDAASEGLNLQSLGTLINLDLPWNPTRLEQRKGRIQRIGQLRDTVYVYNMRYGDSVEDRVHKLLSERLENIYTLFGQIPDVLEDVWIEVALGEIERAKQTIDAVPEQHPFELRYNQIEKVEWESCSRVLDANERKRCLLNGW